MGAEGIALHKEYWPGENSQFYPKRSIFLSNLCGLLTFITYWNQHWRVTPKLVNPYFHAAFSLNHSSRRTRLLSRPDDGIYFATSTLSTGACRNLSRATIFTNSARD